jgi:hypothetical protein
MCTVLPLQGITDNANIQFWSPISRDNFKISQYAYTHTCVRMMEQIFTCY